MDQPITRAEHEEFKRRLEEENARQDRRIALLRAWSGSRKSRENGWKLWRAAMESCGVRPSAMQ